MFRYRNNNEIGDVEIEDLNPNAMCANPKFEIIATDSTGKFYPNARVYIDKNFVGRTSSEDVECDYGIGIPKGTYSSDTPLTVGIHAILVEYDPNPSGDAIAIDMLPDLGAWLRTMGMIVPGSKSVYAYTGYVTASGRPQRFTVKLNPARQNLNPRDYDLTDWYDWLNLFANFIKTPGIS